MGCINSVPQASLMYKDPAGNLHVYNPSEAPNHSPSMQVKHVATREQGKVRGGEEFYLITRSWLTQWIEFTKGDVPKFATRIDNSLLIDPSDANKLLSTVEFKKDYRLVRKEVWEYYFELFGASPIIVLTAPVGCAPEQYASGEWVKFINIPASVTVIYPKLSEEECEVPIVRPGMTDEQVEAAMVMLGGLSRAKSKEAAKLAEEIKAVEAEANSTVMVEMLADMKLKEAEEMKAEVNQANAEAATLLMAEHAAKAEAQRLQAEAKQKEEEANKAAAAMLAKQMADDMEATRARKEAEDAERERVEEQERRLMESFKSMGAKARFRTALQSGKADVAEDAAAAMLQGAWRSKVARRKAEAKKAERDRVRAEMAARKVQNRYRARLARRKVNEVREERMRLKEKACAIKLQSVWRCKKARAQVLELKAKRQALLEEGNAIKLQARWRKRMARKRVQELKEKRQKLLEEAAALRVQSRWRIIKARRRLVVKREERNKITSTNHKAATTIAKRVRRILAARRVLKKQLEYTYFVKFTFVDATGLHAADIKTSDPYVLALGVNTFGKDITETTCAYSTKVVPNTLNPVWNESCYMVGLKYGEAKIVLTLFDKDTVGPSDFLGQYVIEMKKYLNEMSQGATLTLSCDIDSYHYPIKMTNGSPYTVANTNIVGKGKIKVQMSLPPFAYSMCGWVDRLSREVLGSVWKRRYFVLCDKKIIYYDKIDEIQIIKNSLECKDITSITVDDFKGDKCFIISYGKSGDKWTIRFVPDDSPLRIAMWMRKISRSCSLIKEDVEKNAFLRPEAMEDAQLAQRQSEAASMAAPRRRSIFFG